MVGRIGVVHQTLFLCPCCSGQTDVLPGYIAHYCLRANDHYNRDIAIMFGAQLLSFRAFLRAEIAQQSAVSQFAEDADYGLLLRVHCPAIVSESGNSRATLFQIETY